jgi:hypothetical protein
MLIDGMETERITFNGQTILVLFSDENIIRNQNIPASIYKRCPDPIIYSSICDTRDQNTSISFVIVVPTKAKDSKYYQVTIEHELGHILDPRSFEYENEECEFIADSNVKDKSLFIESLKFMLAGCRLQDSKDKLNARINALRKFL